MNLTKTIWIAVIACAMLLLVPALAGALRAHDRGFAIAGVVPAPEEADLRLPAIEYDPVVSASYPVLGPFGNPPDRTF